MDNSDHRKPSHHHTPPPAASNQAPSRPSTATTTTTQPVTAFPNPHIERKNKFFWTDQMQEIEQITDFKKHSLPLPHIKKIMKADEDVKLVSADATVLFAKACEMFISELSLRSWIYVVEDKRIKLHKKDVATALKRTELFDFLVDVVRRDESREEGLEVGLVDVPVVGPPDEGPPYYYVATPVGDGGTEPRDLTFRPWPTARLGRGRGRGGQQSDS